MGKVTFKRSGFGNNVYCVPCDTGIGYKFGMEGDYYPAANHEALEAELAGCRDFSEELKTQLEDIKTDAAKDYRDMRRFQENFINADQERIALRSRIAELEENELELQKTVTAFNEWLDTERRKVAELEAERDRDYVSWETIEDAIGDWGGPEHDTFNKAIKLIKEAAIIAAAEAVKER